jgi:pyruvate/2-oxoglutarate dehydrogenase complex dihydrolipoamide dehydrogenase (E3) component
MAPSGRRTAIVERRWIGGSCPNIACLPSKNEIWSARVAHLARQAFGTVTGPVSMAVCTAVMTSLGGSSIWPARRRP